MGGGNALSGALSKSLSTGISLFCVGIRDKLLTCWMGELRCLIFSLISVIVGAISSKTGASVSDENGPAGASIVTLNKWNQPSLNAPL